MGVRCIRLCKGCGRKFTPKNQKPTEGPGLETEEQEEKRSQETEGRVEPCTEPQEDAGAPPEPEAPGEDDASAEPAHALNAVFPPPDEQWTS